MVDPTSTVTAMCRSIKRLRDGMTPASREEIEEAALQYVRKVSGFAHPAAHNQVVFSAAVAEVAGVTERLLSGLEIRGGQRSAAAS